MNIMYEKRTEEIICAKDGNSTMRIARFLKPIARNNNQSSKIPETPFVSDIFTHQNLQKWPLNVHFTGWKEPQINWMKWCNRLIINHGTSWIETGIVDGIHASFHEIPCNYDLVLGVCEFWCSKTSSFIFPWGESTITLEDVMILGGLPVIGEPVSKPIEGSLVKTDAELRRARKELSEKRGSNGEKEATHSAWIEHFMEEEEEGEIDPKEGEFEHVAFLSLWLSRFVFPDHNEGIISDYVFTIAIHLSQGTPIALAPAALAKLYQELTLLTQNAIDLPLDSTLHASGLFKIVQLWVCERFPEFGAKLTNTLELGYPRVARWDNVKFEVTLSQVRSRLKVGEGFQWRPYASDLLNWNHPPFYEESEQKFSNCTFLEDCLLSFGRFLCSSELNGLETNCREKYQPHRVAMQFGYDQHIPGEFKVSAVNWNKVGLYIPPRTFDPGVSRSYYNWWKHSMVRHQKAVSNYFMPKRGRDSDKVLVERQKIIKCNSSSASSDLDNVPLASRLCTNVANNKARCDDKLVKQHASAAPKSAQFKTTKGSLNSNGAKEAESFQSSESFDMDDVPLYLRLQWINRGLRAREPLDSYADSLASNELFNRVAKLERSVADLQAGKSSDAEFSN